MKKEIVRKWVAALRSGEYKQGTSVLRSSEDRYCCLGVLCELAVKDGVIPPPTRSEDGTYAYAGKSTFPSQTVGEWVGLTTFYYDEGDSGLDSWTSPRDWTVADGSGRAELSALNDINGWSFEQIAAALEAEHLADDKVPANA